MTGGAVQVSIVVPAYNDETHLPGALRRLLAQRGVELEIVVVDDGSSDRTGALADAVAVEDPRVRVLRQERNGGVARARERGVHASRGEWVWFVDSDDEWADDAALRLLTAAQANDADVVVAGARFEFAAGKPGRDLPAPAAGTVDSGEQALRRLLRGEITGHLWNKLFRRTLVERIEFVPARVQSDLPMVASALALADRVVAIADVVYTYRVRAGSIITTTSRRAESLALVHGSVDRSVGRHPLLAGSLDHRYFVSRYVLLSGMKDAVLGGYGGVERDERIRTARSRLRPAVLLVLMRRRDWRRLLLAVSARVSLPAYRRVLRLADR